MIKQFLLNPDGSIPQTVNLPLLEQNGIKLVLPTPMPRECGKVAVEQEPELIDGVWKQAWKLEPFVINNDQESVIEDVNVEQT
jgi:hypothetical protein